MKKADTALIGALLKKQFIETVYRYRRGKFDVVGFLLSLAIVVAIVALFVVFFGKFTGIYTSVKGLIGAEGSELRPMPHPDLRVYELLTLVYAVIFAFMTLSAVAQINRHIFDEDGARLYSAMPIDATSLYIANVVWIYLSQLAVSAVAVFTVNFTVVFNLLGTVDFGWQFWLVSVVVCLLLPLLTIAVGSMLALPFHWFKQLLKDKFLLNFLLVTVLMGAAFYVYSIVLDAVRQMLLGDDLKYYFDEAKMAVIVGFVRYAYPVKWVVDLLACNLQPDNFGIGQGALVAALGISCVLVVCAALSLVMLRYTLQSALQSHNAGSSVFLKKGGNISAGKNDFFALVKKDFLLIFRTPSYMFSYLSVAVMMPLMVYFCMTVGNSLVTNLLGLKAETEIALFLTLLFGALTNIFCATNISRDGEMFYVVKAFPLSFKSVFFSKIFLCMIVTALSQLASAAVLAATGLVSWYVGVFLFFAGTAFGFVNVCVATRYDFNHARFSTDENGEITESNGVVSAMIVLGLLIAFAVGGLLLVVRIVAELKQLSLGWLTFVLGGVIAFISAVLAYLYLIGRLGDKYYRFEGGEI